MPAVIPQYRLNQIIKLTSNPQYKSLTRHQLEVIGKYLNILKEYSTPKRKYFYILPEDLSKLDNFLSQYPTVSQRSLFFAEQTNLARYGVKNGGQAEINKEKRKQTNLTRYGVENAFQAEQFKEKIKKTNQLKYGVNSPLQNKEILIKAQQTNLQRYGVPYTLQNEEVKEKLKQTNLQKYNVPWTTLAPEIRIKALQTYQEHYGSEITNPFQVKEIKAKIEQTNLQKYGAKRFSQSNLGKQQAQNFWEEKPQEYFLNIAKKRVSKYQIENLFFDSLYEIYLYFFFKESNIPFEQKVGIPLKNYLNGKNSFFICDFKRLDINQLIETKNPGFLNGATGTLKDLFLTGLTPEHQEQRQLRNNAKYQAIKDNKILIISDFTQQNAKAWQNLNPDILTEDISFYKNWFKEFYFKNPFPIYKNNSLVKIK